MAVSQPPSLSMVRRKQRLNSRASRLIRVGTGGVSIVSSLLTYRVTQSPFGAILPGTGGAGHFAQGLACMGNFQSNHCDRL